MRDSRLYRTVRNQSIEICIFLRHLQWRWPWYVQSTLMNIVYINILFAISSFWISRKMQLDAAWSHRGAQDWTGTTLTLEIWLLVFLVCSSLMNYNLSYPSVCNSLSTHFFFVILLRHGKIKIKLQKLPIGLNLPIRQLTLCSSSLNQS